MRLNAINENPRLYDNKNYREIEIIVGQKISAKEFFSKSPPESELTEIMKHLDFTSEGFIKNYIDFSSPLKKGEN